MAKELEKGKVLDIYYSAYEVYENGEKCVLEAQSERKHLDPFIAGQYIFASADFSGFATHFPIALSIIGNLCALRSAELIIFVRDYDKTTVERFIGGYRQSEAKVVPMTQPPSLFSGQLIALDSTGRTLGLYTCYKTGFVFVNNIEAIRIRKALLEHM